MDINAQRFYPMGKKTLFMLILRRCLVLVVLVIILFLGLFFLRSVPYEYIGLALLLFLGYFMFLIIFSLVAFFIGWLEYYRYEIVLGDKNLKMQRGLISVEQVGIPYRYIQDIKMERSLLAQIVGVSDLIVTTSGPEQQEINPETDIGPKIVLPAIESGLAHQIQEIILNRAQIQQIDISNSRIGL